MFFVAFDPPILKHRLTEGAKRDGKFDAEDCLCLKFCSPAMAPPPVCRFHVNPLIGFGGDPFADKRRRGTALGPPLSFRQLTLILRGFAFSAFGKTNVITPSFSSALILPCSNLLEIWKLRT